MNAKHSDSALEQMGKRVSNTVDVSLVNDVIC